MIRSDKWWHQHGLDILDVYHSGQVRQYHGDRVISFGTSSAGYDLSLSVAGLQLFTTVEGVTIDPKRFDNRCLTPLSVEHEDRIADAWYTLPPHSYALGVTHERITMTSGWSSASRPTRGVDSSSTRRHWNRGGLASLCLSFPTRRLYRCVFTPTRASASW
jgi:hypothetical protein